MGGHDEIEMGLRTKQINLVSNYNKKLGMVNKSMDGMAFDEGRRCINKGEEERCEFLTQSEMRIRIGRVG